MDNALFESRIKTLETKARYLTGACILLLVVLSAFAFPWQSASVKAADDAKVLRVRGLIIEDAQGRARILLGAPFPSVPERIRQDATGTDLVFLDEKGYDRFRVGEMLPAMPGFHRIGTAYGATILDTKGNERGGLGFLSNGKNVNRATIALDRAGNGSVSADAVGMIVDDATGMAGTAVLYPPTRDRDQEAIMIGTQGNNAFFTFEDLEGKNRTSLALTDGKPTFELFDPAGKPQRDLLNPSSVSPSAHR